ncbi:uncharacterized protein STEHIDRAFT_157966 [Stereum hirsutum FP-91666 SS1]|uniref:uncharacterized protein n=1 Tax=Stereum hirsutum (strain FP-91666) TaxID=721885 RepID=UPI00044499BD|nr:uncharacterized protein STEHIDRAFT_157966 [Stereum hirsutum FP-91666 SS1]EIM85329.1 hypothetical protein STEHIDRAFT_157966 [Stereum hirsutum FP-91666 SS1]
MARPVFGSPCKGPKEDTHQYYSRRTSGSFSLADSGKVAGACFQAEVEFYIQTPTCTYPVTPQLDVALPPSTIALVASSTSNFNRIYYYNMASLSSINEDCVLEIISWLDGASCGSLSRTSKKNARVTRCRRFESVTFGSIDGIVDGDTIKAYCAFVFEHDLASYIKRITVGENRPDTTGDCKPVEEPASTLIIDPRLFRLLQKLIVVSENLQSFAFNCGGKSTTEFMCLPGVSKALGARSLSSLTLTGATAPAINALSCLSSLRILRLVMATSCTPGEQAPAQVTTLLRASSSTLTHLTLSFPDCVWGSELFTSKRIIFPRVQSLTWRVESLVKPSPPALHQVFPNLRSLSTHSSFLARKPLQTDFTPAIRSPLAVTADSKLAEAYARLGGLEHAYPTDGDPPLAWTQELQIPLESLCVPANFFIPKCKIPWAGVAGLRFLQINDIPRNFKKFGRKSNAFLTILDQQVFPRLSYLCLCRHAIVNRSEEDSWTSMMLNRLSGPSGRPLHRTTFTLEVRSIDNKTGELIEWSWFEVVDGEWRLLEEDEGLARREELVGKAHFLA